MGGKGGQTQHTTQTNAPPAWAEPLLRRAAGDAMNLYDAKSGYNIYQGPTRADMSPQTLAGMNAIMAATGGPMGITNQTPQQLFPDVMRLLRQQQRQKKNPPTGGGDMGGGSGGRFA